MHSATKQRRFPAFAALAVLAACLAHAQISGGWSPAATMPVMSAYPTSTVLADGTVLVAGGTIGAANTGELASATYDPRTNSWFPTASMVHPRYLHAATLLCNVSHGVCGDVRVLVVGGLDSGGTAELYDPAYRTWTPTGNLKTPRYAHTASLLPNGMVMVAGGCCDSQGNSLTSSELWNPKTGQWTTGPNMGTARAWQTSTPLNDGRVLVAGGTFRGAASVAAAEVYDPGSGAWIATSSMATARSRHTASLLTDGRVLVTGGNPGGCCSGVASAEIFDPGTQKWQTVQPMSTPRRDHAAAVLSNGSVLVAGGYSCCSDPNPTRSSAEIFNETTQTWRATGSLSQARYGYTLAALSDGTAVAAGGAVTGQLSSLSTAERYQPGTSSPQTVQITIASNVAGANFMVANSGCSPGTYPSPTTLTWNIGANCTVTAIAPSGYLFSTWSDGSTANPISFLAPGTATIFTATFSPAPPPICTFSISPKSQSLSASVNTGSIKIVTAAACVWTASGNAPDWLTITSGATGTGRGTVTFGVKRNTGSTRVGIITVAGQTSTITQRGVR